MSPDEQLVSDLLDRAARRGRTIAVAEALSWGAVVATVSVYAGVVVAVVLAVWRLRETSRPSLVRALERSHRHARNLFVTAGELLSGRLVTKADVRARVFADAAARSRDVQLHAALPIARVARASAVAATAWLLVSTAHFWRTPTARTVTGLLRSQASSETGKTSGALHVTATTQPPAYTGLAPNTLVDPARIDAVQGTVLTFVIDAPSATRATVEHDGTTRTLPRDAAGHFVDRAELTKTGFFTIATDSGGRRLITLTVAPDALPVVRVTTPGRDLVYTDAKRRIAFEVRATDDFGLWRLSLQYTKVSGSGEQFEFQEGEIPLAISRPGSRDWRGDAARSLSDLDLEEGDMLVYRAVASDARPGGGTSTSDAFFIEISKLGAAAGDAFTLPQEETRYALSQQMLILKTDRLKRDRSSMTQSDFNEAALNLAVEQRMIRAEFVFMLGGEVEDEEVEAEQSSELQEGRLQNRGQRDLRAATVAMSQAEKLLTGSDTGRALTAERAAVAALQRAFTRDRYILRALATRTQLDPQRRLTGSLSQAVDWRRERPGAPPNRRAALLQDLLAGIGTLRDPSVEPGSAASGTSSSRAIALAREALLIDAESAVLQRAASDLQRIADTWAGTRVDDRRRAVDAVASSIATETTRALATSALPSRLVAPTLAGAFVDALGHGGAR